MKLPPFFLTYRCFQHLLSIDVSYLARQRCRANFLAI